MKRIFKDHSKPHWLSLMEAALGVAALSDHHKFRVGSALSVEREGQIVIKQSANIIPSIFKKRGFTTYDTVAGHHLSEHGEFILFKDNPDGQDLACNICFCPTCTNLASIYGVNALYYSARVFEDKDLRTRFEKGWQELSIPMARAAGVPVYAVDLKKQERYEIVKGLPKQYRPALPPLFEDQAEIDWDKEIIMPERCAAVTIAFHRKTGEPHLLGAEESLPAGLSEAAHDTLNKHYKNHRYKPGICPIMRLTMEAARRDLSLQGSSVYCNFLPRAARQIDLIACGVREIHIPRITYEKAMKGDTEAFEATVSLGNKNFVKYNIYDSNSYFPPAPSLFLQR